MWICFTCSYYSHLQHSCCVCFFLPPPPPPYPIKKVSKLGCQVSIQIPFFFNIPGWTLPKTKISLQLKGLHGWRSKLDHSVAMWVSHRYPALGRHLTKDEGLLGILGDALLGTRRKFLIDPKAIFFYLQLPGEMAGLTLYVQWPWLSSWLGRCGSQAGWDSKQDLCEGVTES